MIKPSHILTLVFMLLASAATASAQTMNLTAALQNQTSLSNLTTYLGAFPQFVSQLSGQQNITLLAPSNEAFTKLKSAGTSFLLVRSPDAPNSTMAHGPAAWPKCGVCSS